MGALDFDKRHATVPAEEKMAWKCSCEPPENCDNDLPYCTTNIGCFISVPEENDFGPTQGCVSVSKHNHVLLCNSQQVTCCETHLCNNNTVLMRHPQTAETPTALPSPLLWTIVAVVPVAVFVTIVLLLRWRHRRQNGASSKQCLVREYGWPGEGEPGGPLQDGMHSSGSGAGLPRLAHRTVAQHIRNMHKVGQGRFGEVWRGDYNGEHVAVKVFTSRNEMSWYREFEIYTTPMLRHESILGFIACDVTSLHSCTQLWLITDYHEQGSLYDYLRSHVISPAQLVAMLLSAARGLVHLHTEITGTQGMPGSRLLATQGKPAIAHRDVKSKNILVKSNGQCCIADLGLAVTRSGNEVSCLDLHGNHRVGTRRYMAPEVIEGTLTSFEAFCRADVYSFSLVCWETAARCAVDGLVEEHQLPYHDLVPSDPTIEDMRRVVCVQGLRPALPTHWQNHPLLRQLGVMMSECWRATPTSRLTMLRIKKDLFRIRDSMSEQDLDSSDDTKAS